MARSANGPTWVDKGLLITLVFTLIAAGYAACQAKRTADYTRDLVMDSRETAKRELRAYAYAVPGNVYDVSDGSQPEPRVVFRNSGKTFAINVRRSVGTTMSPPLSKEQEAAFGNGDTDEGVGVLSPNGPDYVIVKRPPKLLSGSQALLLSENLRLYVFGRIDYQDSFGQRHWTAFCYYFAGEMADWGEEHGGYGYASNQARDCAGHNSVDVDSK